MLAGLQDGTKWLTYSGNYFGHRHSPLTQITPENVGQLKSAWTFQTGRQGTFQSTPLVIDGVLYVTGWGGDAWAIDARSGRRIWRHRRILPDDIRACCGPNNRGFGVLGDRLFLGTADAHLLSLDMQTGAVIWDAELTNYKSGYSVRRLRRWSSRTKSSLASRAPSTAFADSSRLRCCKPASACGGSIPWPVRMSRAGIRGRRVPMHTFAAAARSG